MKRKRKSKTKTSKQQQQCKTYYWFHHPEVPGLYETLDEDTDTILRCRDIQTKHPLHVYTPDEVYLTFFDDLLPSDYWSHLVHSVTTDRPIDSRHTVLSMDLSTSSIQQRLLEARVLVISHEIDTLIDRYRQTMYPSFPLTGQRLSDYVGVWRGYWGPCLTAHYLTRRDMPSGSTVEVPACVAPGVPPHHRIIRRHAGMQAYVDRYARPMK